MLQWSTRTKCTQRIYTVRSVHFSWVCFRLMEQKKGHTTTRIIKQTKEMFKTLAKVKYVSLGVGVFKSMIPRFAKVFSPPSCIPWFVRGSCHLEIRLYTPWRVRYYYCQLVISNSVYLFATFFSVWEKEIAHSPFTSMTGNERFQHSSFSKAKHVQQEGNTM